MNRRQLKKALSQMRRTPGGRDQLLAVIEDKDRKAFAMWADTPNGSERLQAIYQATDDMDDTLAAISRAVRVGDTSEAQRLIEMGRDSLAEHIAELKGLL